MMLAVSLPFLNELVALFVVSVGIAYLCYRFHLVPIIGFLIAGVIIGPHALGLVPDQELVDMLAEIGIILLLFTIGLEFSLDKLNRIRNAIFVGGGLQVLLTIAITAAGLFLVGQSWQIGVYTGCLVALSSTAIILGLLSDEGLTDTPAGQLSLAVLIFQDLAIIVMVLLIPLLSGSAQNANELWLVLGKAVLLIAVVLLLAQRLVPWMLEKIAETRRQELFLLTVVAICFGTAALSNLAGVSLALGAFLAGLVVSESHYSEQALSEILPLRTIFNAVFFVSVGMLLDVGIILQHPLLIIGAALTIIFIKCIITTGSLLALRYPIRIVAASGLALAQIGEFSFVLERAGRAAGLYPAGLGPEGSQLFIAISVLLMIATPFMVKKGPDWGLFLNNWLAPLAPSNPETTLQKPEVEPLEDHVVIIGYGPAGRHLEQVLHDTGIPYVIIEMNPGSINELAEKQIPFIFGDASRPHILEAAHIASAKMCVIATNDARSTPLIISQARYLNPTLQVVVRTRYLNEVQKLEHRGADIVVPEEMETTVRLFSHVLQAYMISPEEIRQHVQEVRAHDYEIMRGSVQEAHLMVLQGLDEEGLHTRIVVVRPNSPAEGQTLEQLQLRKNYGIAVLTIRRGDEAIANPAGTDRLHAGDRLVMMADATQFTTCAELFRPFNQAHKET